MSKPVKWYEIKALASNEDKTAEVYIYGNIGDRWDENGVIAADFVKEIAALDVDRIIMRINSFGGSVPDGLAIYNALKRHPASIDVQVDGVALSCASYIAMAGDTITLAENAQLMIHAPWGVAIGNAADLRLQADVLDGFAKALAHGYATQQGDFDACLAMLTDGKDHWLSAEDAVAQGFADFVGAPVAIAASLSRSFDLSRFAKPAASAVNPAASPAAQPVKEPIMAGTPTADAPVLNTEEIQAAALKADALRRKEIAALFEPFAHRDGVAAIMTKCQDDTRCTADDAGKQLLAILAKDKTPVNPVGAAPRVETMEDETDKMRAAAVQSIMARAGVPGVKADATNPLRGYKMLDLARASLQRAGIKTDGMDQMQIVAAAFTQSTSDFPVLLENAMHKTLQAAYARAPLTWRRFCAVGSVSDFRAHNRYQRGSFGNLDAINELGEFVNKSIPDGEKQSLTAATKGNIINLSRKAVINDDLGAFIGLANDLGAAAARTVESDVYALLAQNSGLGPTMSDGNAMFFARTATGTNISTGAALSMAAIDADRVVMASQKDISGNDYLDLRPAVLLVPLSLGGQARVINSAQYDPDTANKLQKPNVVNGLFADIVDTPRLSGTRRYLFADPMEAPVIEVAFLDGAQDPYLEVQNGFDVDGAKYKVRLDYAVGGVGYQGAVTNAGA